MSVRMGGSYNSFSLRPAHPGRASARATAALAALRRLTASLSVAPSLRESSRRSQLPPGLRPPRAGDRPAVLATVMPVTGPTHPYLRALWRTEARVASVYAAEPSAPARQVATPPIVMGVQRCEVQWPPESLQSATPRHV